jgi:hypothetical protein
MPSLSTGPRRISVTSHGCAWSTRGRNRGILLYSEFPVLIVEEHRDEVLNGLVARAHRWQNRTMKPVVIEEVTDPLEIAKAQAQRARFDRNSAFLEAHAREVYTRHRGKCVCVAGEELFVADTPVEAMALAREAHPDDDGSFVRYIPREKLARIYANQR